MELSWSDGDIELLGVKIRNAKQQNVDCYSETINKFEQIALNKRGTNATLMGRVLLINSLMGSLFVYPMMTMPNLNVKQIVKLNTVMKQFLWPGSKRAKIKLEVLQTPKDMGGLGLIHFEHKQTSLKIGWLKRIMDHDEFNYIYDFLLPEIDQDIWICALNQKDICNLIPFDSFWRELLLEWAKVQYTEFYTGNEYLQELLWYNSKLRKANKPFIIIKAYEAGLKRIGDIVTESRLKTYDEITLEYGPVLTWLEYNQVKSAFPKLLLGIGEGVEQENIYKLELTKVLHARKPVSYVYHHLVKCKAEQINLKKVRTFIDKMEQQIENFEDFTKICKHIYKVTKNTKLRDFQYRFMHNIIPLNDRLFKWKLKTSPLCDLCNQRKQTVKHFFWECSIAQSIWCKIKEIFIGEELTYTEVANLRYNDRAIIGCIILITKQYMYRQKCMDLPITLPQLYAEIKLVENMEYFGAKRKDKIDQHVKRWSFQNEIDFLPKRHLTQDGVNTLHVNTADAGS